MILTRIAKWLAGEPESPPKEQKRRGHGPLCAACKRPIDGVGYRAITDDGRRLIFCLKLCCPLSLRYPGVA